MNLLLLKLTLIPALLLIITAMQKRFGHKVAGILSGMPVIIGPIMFLLAMEHGQTYSVNNVGHTVVGMFPFIFFLITYLECAKKHGPIFCVTASMLAYFISGLPLTLVEIPLVIQFTLAIVAIPLGLLYLYFQKDWGAPDRPQHNTFWWRAIAGIAATLTVTFLSYTAPPALIGLLTITPVATPIVLGFSHYDNGHKVLNKIALGVLAGNCGLIAFAAALLVVPVSWPVPLIYILCFLLAGIVAALAGSILGKLPIGKNI